MQIKNKALSLYYQKQRSLIIIITLQNYHTMTATINNLTIENKGHVIQIIEKFGLSSKRVEMMHFVMRVGKSDYTFVAANDTTGWDNNYKNGTFNSQEAAAEAAFDLAVKTVSELEAAFADGYPEKSPAFRSRTADLLLQLKMLLYDATAQYNKFRNKLEKAQEKRDSLNGLFVSAGSLTEAKQFCLELLRQADNTILSTMQDAADAGDIVIRLRNLIIEAE